MVISRFPWEIVMLEHYYFRPETIDRIRASWLAPAIEQYVTWLTEAHYTARSVLHRVPVLMSFGEYAKAHGARDFAQLSDHVTVCANLGLSAWAWTQCCPSE